MWQSQECKQGEYYSHNRMLFKHWDISKIRHKEEFNYLIKFSLKKLKRKTNIKIIYVDATARNSIVGTGKKLQINWDTKRKSLIT